MYPFALASRLERKVTLPKTKIKECFQIFFFKVPEMPLRAVASGALDAEDRSNFSEKGGGEGRGGGGPASTKVEDRKLYRKLYREGDSLLLRF